MAKGSSGASASPKIAKITKMPTITTPAMNVFERTRRRSRSLWAVRSASAGGAVAAAGLPALTSVPEAEVLIARSQGARAG